MVDFLALLLILGVFSPELVAGWIARLQLELPRAHARYAQKERRQEVVRRAKAIRAARNRRFAEARA